MYTTPSPTAGILTITYLNIISKLFKTRWNIFGDRTISAFRMSEVYKMVLAQWRFMGDSVQEGESRKLYSYMQDPRFIERVMRDIYSYRPSESQFDSYEKNFIPEHYLEKIFKTCEDNITTDPFIFNNYQNNYRLSICDFVEFEKHDSMDIIVFDKNFDTVVISTSLTSRFVKSIIFRNLI